MRSYKNLLKKNKNMVINVSAEGIATIRQAILHCANELMAAVNCEDRFNDVLISDTMGALANAISRVDDRLEGAWFSARVRVPGGEAQMLTTSEGRHVSNRSYVAFAREHSLTIHLLFL